MLNSKKQKARDSKSERTQTAVEYLSVFSWVLLILIIIIVALSYFVSNRLSSTNLPATCIISAALNCKQLFIMQTGTASSNALVIFINQNGANIVFQNAAFQVQPDVSNTLYTGNCFPVVAMPGTPVSCIAAMPGYWAPLGSQASPKMSIGYKICGGGSDCAGSPKLNTTGTGIVYVSSYVPSYQITLYTSAVSGSASPGGGIALGGVNYPSGTTLLLLGTVSYTISANPPKDYLFNAWSTTGGAYIPPANTNTVVAPADAAAPGTITAVLSSTSGPVFLSFKYNVIMNGQSDLGTAIGNTGDTIVICGSSNTGGIANSACSGPDKYLVATGAANSGAAAYDTLGLAPAVYNFEACDLTYYQKNNMDLCGAVQGVSVIPIPMLSIQYNTYTIGTSDTATAAVFGTDTALLCIDKGNPSNIIFACNSPTNMQVGNSTSSFSIDLNNNMKLAAGTYNFEACDLTYYRIAGQLGCSSTQQVVVQP